MKPEPEKYVDTNWYITIRKTYPPKEGEDLPREFVLTKAFTEKEEQQFRDFLDYLTVRVKEMYYTIKSMNMQ